MKSNKVKLALLISLIIFISFLILGVIDFNNYNTIISDDNLKIIKLISTNIYSEINIELNKPLFVSLTMANDQFLKDWILKKNEGDLKTITSYLQGIKKKYNYDSVFYVSNITQNYYHHNGILKQMSQKDNHDDWFYSLLERDVIYELDVDTDEASEGRLTVFVNCKIFDEKGNVLGITGVGLRMDKIIQILQYYEDSLDVEVVLIDSRGIIQVPAEKEAIGQSNIFDTEGMAKLKNDILSEKDEMKVFELGSKYAKKYVTSYYIEELDWYAVITKSTSIILNENLKWQIISKSIIFLVVLLSAIGLNIKIIQHYQSKVDRLASIDNLTELNNRRMFDYYLQEFVNISSKKGEPLTLVFCDIDNFKLINDKYGHIIGDEVIKVVADHIKRYIRKNDAIARWGGDEFAIIFRCNVEDALKIVKRTKEADKGNPVLSEYNITFSIGMAEYREGDTPESILKRADKALQNAKKDGKNQIRWK